MDEGWDSPSNHREHGVVPDQTPTYRPEVLAPRLRKNGADDLADRIEKWAAEYVCPECDGKNGGCGLTQEPDAELLFFCLDCSPRPQEVNPALTTKLTFKWPPEAP